MTESLSAPLLPAGEIEIASLSKRKSVSPFSLEITNYKNALFSRMVSITNILTNPYSSREIPTLCWIDDETIVTGDKDGLVVVWDINKEKTAVLYSHSDEIFSIDCSPNGKYLLISYSRGFLVIIDLKSEEIENQENQIKKTYGVHNYVTRVDWHPFDERFAVCAGNNVFVYGLDSEESVLNFDHNSCCQSVQWNSEGTKLASCGDDARVVVWDIETKKEFKILIGHEQTIYYIEWNEDGDKIYSAGKDGKVLVWDVVNERVLLDINPHYYEIWALSLSPNEEFLAIVGKDKSLTVFDVNSPTAEEIYKNTSHQETSAAVKWNSDGKKIATVGYDGKLIIYDWRISLDIPHEKQEMENNGWCFANNEEPKRIAIGCKEGNINVWNFDAENNSQHHVINELNGRVTDVRWYQSNKLLASTDLGEILLFDFENQSTIWIFDSKDLIESVIATSDLSVIISAGRNIRIFDKNLNPPYAELKTLDEHRNLVRNLEINKRETLLLSCSNDSTIRVWDREKNWAQSLVISKHIGEVSMAIWSPDDYYIVSGGTDRVIRVFNAEFGFEVMKMKGHEGLEPIYWISWLDNGKKLISVTEHEDFFKIWDFDTGKLIKNVNVKPGDCILEADKEGNIAITGSDTCVKLFSKNEIWTSYNEYKALYYISNILPKINQVDSRATEFINELINCFFLNNISIFHVLAEKGINKGLKVILDYCIKKEIYPHKFYDSPDKRLLSYLLTNNLSVPVIDAFIEYAIKANVESGNLFIITSEDLCFLMNINSLSICKLLDNRFRKAKKKYFNIEWLDESKDKVTSTVKNCLRMKSSDFVDPQNSNFIANTEVKFHPLDSSSTSVNFMKFIDIPLMEFSSDFLTKVSDSSAFDDFCRTNFIVSFLDLMWFRWVRMHFFKSNVILLLYLFLFTVNSLFILPNFIIEKENAVDGYYWIPFFVLSILSGLTLFKITYKEIYQFKSNSSEYFNSIWNYIDITNIIVSLTCFIYNQLVIFEVLDHLAVIRILNSFALFVAMIRIFDFFRAFRKTCYLIEIVVEVLSDMRVFLFLMFLLLFNFSCSGKKKKQLISVN